MRARSFLILVVVFIALAIAIVMLHRPSGRGSDGAARPLHGSR
jgi:preprotein translocase subunit SecG